ncbi:DNA-directed RNA polymerase II subunit RPB7 isoform X2 [Morus notabilis]|uniref:DNA-directed RNA polymerase II subunit RPB7 isoform X2 n=1 Tax=Morus notabilis TaxID=981085 RepID=UPI000CED310D|nr:DNA-directed RNA polymerase II subunit RPB7 isoform X2 [Morus notabilis]
MFFHIVLERNIQLHPRHFGRNLRDNIVSKLMKGVEGTCSGRHGFVVAITGIENIGKGLIRDGTGFVTFPVKYQCVVFRPFKGEILEAVVSMVNKMGFFAEAGPVQIFVSNHVYYSFESRILTIWYQSLDPWLKVHRRTIPQSASLA